MKAIPNKALIAAGVVVGILILSAAVGYGYFQSRNKDVLLNAQRLASPSPTATSATENWQTYANTQFGFEFKYPVDLTLAGPAHNVNTVGETYSITLKDAQGADQLFFLIQTDSGTDPQDCSANQPTLGAYMIAGQNRPKCAGATFHKEEAGGWETTLSLQEPKALLYIDCIYGNVACDQVLSTFKLMPTSPRVVVLPRALELSLMQDLASQCVGEKGSPTTLTSIDQISFLTLSRNDLNNDGIEEAIIAPQSICGVSVRGAQNNGYIYVYQSGGGSSWKKVGSLEGNTYQILTTQTGGYYDIATFWHKSASSGIKRVYSWDIGKGMYVGVSQKEVPNSPDWFK